MSVFLNTVYYEACEETFMNIYAKESGELDITREGFGEKVKNAADKIYETIKGWIQKVIRFIGRVKDWIVKNWNAFVAKFRGDKTITVPNIQKSEQAQNMAEKAAQALKKAAIAEEKAVESIKNEPSGSTAVQKDEHGIEGLDDSLDEFENYYTQMLEYQKEAEANPQEIKDPNQYKKFTDVALRNAKQTEKCIEFTSSTGKKIQTHGKRSRAAQKAEKLMRGAVRGTKAIISPIQNNKSMLGQEVYDSPDANAA